MGRFVIRRLLVSIPLLIGISFLVFALINLVPGSPIAEFEFNPRMSQADIDRIESNLGLDEPWYERYFTWLADVAQGNLGYSLINGASVWGQIINVLPNTLLLTSIALAIALIFSIPLGVVSAVKRNSLADNVIYAVANAMGAIPTFWLGLLLIILFSVKFNEWGLPSLPVGGTHDLRGDGGFVDRVRHLLMPAITLAAVQTAGWMLYIRSSMLEVIRQDFVRTAESKGLSRRSVIYGHAFRNALLPLVTLIGLTIPELFAGAFIVEQIFAWPGIGRLAVDAATNSDYTLIMGSVLVFAVLTLLANLLADVMYAVLDPRIRYD
jgi:peptide/nickel transport system permease protein